jgi:phage shock protein C
MNNDTANQSTHHAARSLRRNQDGMLGGVASGVAIFLGVRTTYMRIAFVALSILGGGGLALYLAGWAFIPEDGSQISLAEQMMRRTTRHSS